MKKLFILLLLAFVSNAFAQNPIVMALWPNGAPNDNGLKGKEVRSESGRYSNVYEATITVFKSDVPNSTTVIMCPGGGYHHLAMNHEGFDMAPWFNAQHITYVVLKYRMPNGNYEVPLSDAEQVIKIVRQNANAWNVNPERVGIMGCSAGGHLASTLAVHYSCRETRPDFQILLYPVISMVKCAHVGSRDNLMGKSAPEEIVNRFSNELHITNDTPKAFIVLSSDDTTVNPQNSIDYYLSLLQHNVRATLHIFSSGRHGWGFRDSFIYKRQWTEELEKWLREEVM